VCGLVNSEKESGPQQEELKDTKTAPLAAQWWQHYGAGWARAKDVRVVH
jgi:hypothetical protein